MRHLAVLAKALAVVRCDDDERWAGKRGEPIEERSERAIDERDFTVVRLRGVGGGEIGRRLVRRVRIEHVDPREEPSGCLADPLDRTSDHFVGPALGHREADIALELGDVIVVDVESRRQPEALRERKPADERARRKARRLEPRGERRGAVLDAKPAVVAHAMLVRQPSGEDGGVRRQRHDRVRVREREPRAAGGQTIEVRRLRPPTVRPERVRSQRVDGHEQDVLVGVRLEHERVAPGPEEADDSDDRQCRRADEPL